ncbi:MAG TPA: Dabb family protein [Bacteroidales bacterium]|nr:Dabb family protein [Bacteroidales bacterium]
MIEHIVMFRLHSESKGQVIELKDKLDALEDKIDDVLKIETGINFADRSDAYDLMLKVHVKDKEGLKAYAEHPEHQQVLKFIKQVVDQTAVVDFMKE